MRAPLRRPLGTGLLLLGLGGCGAYEESVEMFVPLHRLDLPEKPERAISAGQSLSTAGVRIGLTRSQSSTPPDPGGSQVGQETVPFPIVFAEFYPVEAVSLGYDYAEFTSDERHGTVRFKAHLLGPPAGRAAAGDVSLALTYGYSDNGYDYRGYDASTTLQARGNDFAAIAGLRAARWLLLYGGPYRHELHYNGQHQSPSAEVPLSGDAELTGFNFGLSFNPGVRWMSLMAEYSRAHVRAGAAAADEEALNGALRFNFGWRHAVRPGSAARPGGAPAARDALAECGADAPYSDASTCAAARSPERTAPSM